jgi:hypothetical protein
VLNGHSENESPGFAVLNQIIPKYPGSKALLIDWWNILPEEIITKYIPEKVRPYIGAHASYLETLALLAVRPDLVNLKELKISRADRAVRYEILPMEKQVLPTDGVAWEWDEPVLSTLTPERAANVFNAIVDLIVDAVQKEFGTPEASKHPGAIT